MTAQEIIEKIRAEVERRANGEQVYNSEDAEFGYKSCARELLSILSDLEKEEKPSEGLEEEIREFVEQEWDGLHDNDGNPLYTADYLEYIARHFAKWGAEHAREQMMDEWLKDRDGCFWDGVEEGKKAMEEQMMKGAVEGEVCGRVYDHINVRFADGVCKFLEPKNISHIPADVSKYNIGQKVKIIIVKEEKDGTGRA